MKGGNVLTKTLVPLIFKLGKENITKGEVEVETYFKMRSLNKMEKKIGIGGKDLYIRCLYVLYKN